MRLTKQPKLEFDYIATTKKINKMHDSPHNLSKNNKIINKNQNSNVIIKNYIFNENIPIKVRLIKAEQLNQNMDKISNTDKNCQKFKKKIINKYNKSYSSMLKNNSRNIEVSQNNLINNRITSNNKSEIKSNQVNNILSNDSISETLGELNKLKDLLIYVDKKKRNSSSININNIKTHKNCSDNISVDECNYNSNTYNKNTVGNWNLYKQKILYNKPLKRNTGISNSQILYTETNLWEGISSDNIISNYDNKNNKIFIKKRIKSSNSTNILKRNTNNKIENYNEDIIKVNKKNNIKAYIKSIPKKPNSNNKNTPPFSPIKVKNYNNNSSFNITHNNYKYIYYNPKKEIIYKNSNNNDDIEIQLEDLILYEEKLNDIYTRLININGQPFNECPDFFLFYFNSSLKYISPYFFNGKNKPTIKSAINLSLFSIIIIYHLSFTPLLLQKLINELKNIFSLSKNNFYLFIRKIQLFYGEKYIKKNEIYFKDFNNILTKNGFLNLNENQIIQIINRNCCEIINNINNILNFYKSIENNYYLDFFELFSSISKITEIDIQNYFYKHLFSNSSKHIPKPKYKPVKKNVNIKTYENNDNDNNINNNNNNKNINNNSDNNNNNNDNNNKLNTKKKEKEKELEIKTILKYHKYKLSPPFLKKPNDKKYTLILNLEEVFINRNSNGYYNIRPGFFSFLKEIKPYYELISFTNESKYSSDCIIKKLEIKNKYFDYNLYREHLTFDGKDFVKDISKLGRDIKKIIIVDNCINEYKLNSENVIQIPRFLNESFKNNNILFELKKILFLIYKSGYDDIRIALKKYNKTIKNNMKEIEK